MHAGSSPSLTRSVHSVHLKTRLVFGFIFGMSNGHPVMQYPQPMQLACWKSTMPSYSTPTASSISAADAVGLLEIDDAVGVLYDGSVRGTCRQASRLRAVHALVF